MKIVIIALISLTFLLTACAETTVQSLSQNSFKVSTVAECGRTGTRNITFQAAAIEVIRRGGDIFIITGDQSGSEFSGMTYSPYTGFMAYSNNLQDIVVLMLTPADAQYRNGLSARQELGSNWQEIVAAGAPNTCT